MSYIKYIISFNIISYHMKYLTSNVLNIFNIFNIIYNKKRFELMFIPIKV